jgi:integrase/recombinase XerC
MQAEPLTPYVQSFFRDFLVAQRNASPNTVLGYRDALKLLLIFAADRARRAVTDLRLDDVDPDTVLAFLDHLERDRGCGTATRNARLAAIRTFFRYVARQEPTVVDLFRRVADIPAKKREVRLPTYLELDELDGVLSRVERATALGRRDYALLWLLYDTGARVSEIVNLNVCAVRLEAPEQVRLLGKGRKERVCPISTETAKLLRGHLSERGVPLDADVPLFVNRLGVRLARGGIARRIRRHARTAAGAVAALAERRVSPHTFRHTTAMHLLQSGVDLRVISAILGHASMLTTHHYTRIDLAMKRKALEKVAASRPPVDKPDLPLWHRELGLLEWLERVGKRA